MSSSKSSQWIPSPLPIRRQFARSAGVPCARRGNQATGTVIVLPSARFTSRASSLTLTLWAAASRSSAPKYSCHALSKKTAFSATSLSMYMVMGRSATTRRRGSASAPGAAGSVPGHAIHPDASAGWSGPCRSPGCPVGNQGGGQLRARKRRRAVISPGAALPPAKLAALTTPAAVNWGSGPNSLAPAERGAMRAASRRRSRRPRPGRPQLVRPGCPCWVIEWLAGACSRSGTRQRPSKTSALLRHKRGNRLYVRGEEFQL